MARGIFTLSKVKTKKIKDEWEDPNNVWIFPDGGGPEFKFIDGTVTPAPPATSLGPSYDRVGFNDLRYEFHTSGLLRGICSTDDLIFFATRSNTDSILIYKRENLFVWDSTNNRPTISINPDDYPPGGLRKISHAGAADDQWWGTYLTVDDVNEKICIGSTTGAHLYNYDGTGYVNIDKAATTPGDNTPSADGGIAESFGLYSACGNGKVVIGNPYEHKSWNAGSLGGYSGNWPDHGAVYVYNLDGTGEFKIQPTYTGLAIDGIIQNLDNDRGTNIRFGISVAIDSNRIIVGAEGMNVHSSSNAPGNNGAIWTYKLDGTNETLHYGEDLLSEIAGWSGAKTFGNFTGSWLAAKHGKIITGSGLDDQHGEGQGYGGSDRDNTGVVYIIDVPSQTSTGASTMTNIFRDFPGEDDFFGVKTNIGKTVLSSGITTTMFVSMAPWDREIYYHQQGENNLSNSIYNSVLSSQISTFVPVEIYLPPLDISDFHIITGQNHLSTATTAYASRMYNGSSQIMDAPPLL